MTISVSTKTIGSLTAYHQTVDGVPGFILSGGVGGAVFLDKDSAQDLGRYLLFEDEGDAAVEPEGNTEEFQGEPAQETVETPAEPEVE